MPDHEEQINEIFEISILTPLSKYLACVVFKNNVKIGILMCEKMAIYPTLKIAYKKL